MKLKIKVLYILLFITIQVYSQEKFHTSFTLPSNLKENVNAVIRSNDLIIKINSVNDMTVYEKRIIIVPTKLDNPRYS